MRKKQSNLIQAASKPTSNVNHGEAWNSSLMVSDGRLVLGKLFVDAKLHDRVLAQYFQILPNLVKDCNYTAVDLLGDRFLTSLSEYEARMALVILKGMMLGDWTYSADKAEGVIFTPH